MTESGKKYYLIDASKKPLGRIATQVAVLLMGKNSVEYKPNVCPKNIVVVVNAGLVKLSGDKSLSKDYKSYSGYHGGLKAKTFAVLKKENPNKIIWQAVKGMLPKNRLTKEYLLNMKINVSDNHPYGKEKIIEIEV